jgi:hypothetical protein
MTSIGRDPRYTPCTWPISPHKKQAEARCFKPQSTGRALDAFDACSWRANKLRAQRPQFPAARFRQMLGRLQLENSRDLSARSQRRLDSCASAQVASLQARNAHALCSNTGSSPPAAACASGSGATAKSAAYVAADHGSLLQASSHTERPIKAYKTIGAW